jgi:uridine kinase
LRVFCVGITGGTASGKSRFARTLCDQLADVRVTVLHQDQYFRDWDELGPGEAERQRTANSPPAVLWEPLVAHMIALRRGECIDVPVEGTRALRRGIPQTTVGPVDVVILEGHMIFWDARIREMMDLRIFMEVDADERMLRRVIRDTKERGMSSVEAVAAWYRRDVAPNQHTFTEPARRQAHLIVPYGSDNPVATDIIASGIRVSVGRS